MPMTENMGMHSSGQRGSGVKEHTLLLVHNSFKTWNLPSQQQSQSVNLLFIIHPSIHVIFFFGLCWVYLF